MTGPDLRILRVRIGLMLGRHVSQRDLGLALRLAPNNAKDTVRSWEDGSRDITGPASVACNLMGDCISHGGAPMEFVRNLFNQS